jgi:demethylmenaquinone methyltransferase/2-methoxy-6-polyprenyl-1,4-benzoquinol methylase
MAEEVTGFFTYVAPRYEQQTRLLTWGSDQRWRRFLAACMYLPAGGKVLDIGSGTGQMARMAADLPSHPYTIGLDNNPAMLRVAASRSQGRPNLEFRQGSADSLPFPDGSFDAVTMGFALRIMPGRILALQQCLRVLKSKGRIYLLETSYLHGWRRWLLEFVQPRLPGILKRLNPRLAAYCYLLDSMLDFPPTETVHQLLTKAGFVAPRSYKLTPGWAEAHIAEKK